MKINDPRQWKVDVRRIGRERHEILVVDEFLAEPEAVRKQALGLSYERPAYPYPGVVAHPAGVEPEFVSALGTLLGRTLLPERVRFRFSVVMVGPDELLPCQRVPHVDPVLVAGLVYLSRVGAAGGGTSFYRHRLTGVESLPAAPDAAYRETMGRFGFDCLEDWASFLLTPPPEARGYISGSTEQWERVELVEMRWNRLLVYNGKLFHSASIPEGNIGEEWEQRRLTLNLFITAL